MTVMTTQSAFIARRSSPHQRLIWREKGTEAGEELSEGVGWRSGRAAVIVVDDAAEDGAALDRTSVLGLAVGDRGMLVDALMRASNVVITVGELAQNSLEMDIIEDEEMVQAFLSGGTDPAFREGIGLHRQLHPY